MTRRGPGLTDGELERFELLARLGGRPRVLGWVRRWRVRRARRLLGLARLPIVECDRAAGGAPIALLPIGTTADDKAIIEAWLRDWNATP